MRQIPQNLSSGLNVDQLEAIAADWEKVVLYEELNRLPEVYQTVLLMNFFAGRSTQQIANELETTKGVIDGRLKRAYQALRVRMVKRGVTMGLVVAAGVCVGQSASAAPAALLAQTLANGIQIAQHSKDVSVQSTVHRLARPETAGLRISVVHVLTFSVLMFIGAAGWQHSESRVIASDEPAISLLAAATGHDGPSSDESADAGQIVVFEGGSEKPQQEQPSGKGAEDDQHRATDTGRNDERLFRNVPESELLAADGEWGGIAGQITLEGPIPNRKLLHAAGAAVKGGAVCAAVDTFEDSLIVDAESKGIANCFVYLYKAPATIHPMLAEPAVKKLIQDQKGCRFVPHAQFVQVGQTVETISSDPVVHNVHQYPLRNHPTSVVCPPNTRAGRGIPWTPLQSERMAFEVRCDFHVWMKAYWLVLDHPYAAITDSKGRFRIIGMPAGLHEFRIWHERVGLVDRKYRVIVKAEEVRNQQPLKVNVSRFE